MKIKNEFVTNSSSSSFVVMGIYMDDSDISDRIIELVTKKGSVFDPSDRFFDNLEILTDGTDLAFSTCGNWDGDSVAIGICYTKMDGEETLNQFKERVKKQIEEAFGIVKNPGHIEAGWEDR